MAVTEGSGAGDGLIAALHRVLAAPPGELPELDVAGVHRRAERRRHRRAAVLGVAGALVAAAVGVGLVGATGSTSSPPAHIGPVVTPSSSPPASPAPLPQCATSALQVTGLLTGTEGRGTWVDVVVRSPKACQLFPVVRLSIAGDEPGLHASGAEVARDSTGEQTVSAGGAARLRITTGTACYRQHLDGTGAVTLYLGDAEALHLPRAVAFHGTGTCFWKGEVLSDQPSANAGSAVVLDAPAAPAGAADPATATSAPDPGTPTTTTGDVDGDGRLDRVVLHGDGRLSVTTATGETASTAIVGDGPGITDMTRVAGVSDLFRTSGGGSILLAHNGTSGCCGYKSNNPGFDVYQLRHGRLDPLRVGGGVLQLAVNQGRGDTYSGFRCGVGAIVLAYARPGRQGTSAYDVDRSGGYALVRGVVLPIPGMAPVSVDLQRVRALVSVDCPGLGSDGYAAPR